jgi:uncharacterized protein (DUF488 family)
VHLVPPVVSGFAPIAAAGRIRPEAAIRWDGLRMRLFTIGFTKKTARQFFTRLMESGVRRVVDVRLNNVSQLAGFTKKDDLKYFLRAIGEMDYVHIPELAPTQKMLDTYKKEKGDWAVYEREFLELIKTRRIEESMRQAITDNDCLLCSEPTAEHCHRRLVAEYLQQHWPSLEISHLR